jgi:acyl-CoA thioester hydrolase
MSSSHSAKGLFYTHNLRVPFADTDMAGIVHFSAFFRYIEQTEHAFFRSKGLSIWEPNNSQIPPQEQVAWPRVHVSCDYFIPLRFEEEFHSEIAVLEIKSRSVHYGILFFNQALQCVARGKLIAASIQKNSDGQLKAVTLPPHFTKNFNTISEDLRILWFDQKLCIQSL